MEREKIHIGNLIRIKVNQRDMTLQELADAIGISKQRLNGWLKKDDISVKTLFTISKVLDYDFIRLFNQPEENNKKKMIIQIEVDDAKQQDILNYLDDKQIKNILTP